MVRDFWDNLYMKDEIILRKFSRRVRSLRKKQRLTQQQLAELADMEYKYLQRIESQKPPSIGLIKFVKLTQALRIPIAQFFDFLK